MPIWIVFAALGSIVATLALSWVLWRVNAPETSGEAREGATQPIDASGERTQWGGGGGGGDGDYGGTGGGDGGGDGGDD